LDLRKSTSWRKSSLTSRSSTARDPDDVVGIDIRIEEQYGVRGELEEDLLLLTEREDIIRQAAAYTGKTPSPGKRPIQLSFFDSARKREKVGVPC